MDYRWNPDQMTEVLALPAALVDRHIRLAGSAQLKVLLWLARAGKGHFDPEACGAAIGLSPADCTDALQYWVETGILQAKGDAPAHEAGRQGAPLSPPMTAANVQSQPVASEKTAAYIATQNQTSSPRPRPAAVKPQLKEVIARQKASPEFDYLLQTASARLGKAISPGDMETLLYLYDTAGMPVEVILMVIEYAVAEGKTGMRYVEKVALDWADKGIDSISAAEQHLCRLERRRHAWDQVKTTLGLVQSGTAAQIDAAEKWIYEWHIQEDLLRLAHSQCVEKIGKFNSSYVDKILEHWRLDGIDTAEKALVLLEKAAQKGNNKPKRETSFDLDAYTEMEMNYTPVFHKDR